MLMRTALVTQKLLTRRLVLRVVPLDHFSGQWQPDILFAVRVESSAEIFRMRNVVLAGVNNTIILTSDAALLAESPLPGILDVEGVLEEGDVLGVTPGLNKVRVLFRESDMHHTVFLTNRCNSFCLMCSQPPTRHNDSWLIDEAISVATHMRVSPTTIGFTGGEPLLLNSQLRVVLNAFQNAHPTTRLEVLTNGRLFSEAVLANCLLSGLGRRVTWMIPLYGHADFLHDYIVQTHGAFEQTINGLLTLQSYEQQIQLRTVLIGPVLRYLPELCDFICRNLPFVREVSLMGCEPIGFALANHEQCQVDLANWQSQLTDAVERLRRGGLRVILMNLPLCALPRSLWRDAQQSISDWKQVFADECTGCEAKSQCCGLFAWHQKGWKPTFVRPITEKLIYESI